ncbi:unnamed protein product [Thlaspi arvense]|uniref:DUF7755 domain-containing protein n=1 Tax=Thlaspi arvense TaxID=13288 RepID=A0AAU9R8Q9_THLAR|nr:unnamed protein product [Thlaspi arvense]
MLHLTLFPLLKLLKVLCFLDFQSYARPLRLLPAEEVKVYSANPSFTVSESRSLYKVKLQTSSLLGSGISDMNARVLICLIDQRGDSVLQTIPANLSSEVTEDGESFNFQRGSLDEFAFEGPRLGKIRAFWISLESGQWRVGGVSLWVAYPRGQGTVLRETNDCDRYDFEVDDILLGESSELSMVELRPTRITEVAGSDQISSSSALDLDRTIVSKEQSMEEYADLKLSLLLYDAILILVGSSVFSFSLGQSSAVAFFFGGTMGFLYLLLLQRSVDELQAPGSSSPENSSQILSGRLKIPVLSLALAVGLSILAVRGYIGEDHTAFVVTPKEILVGTLGFLVCKVAVVLAAFKPLKEDGS